VSDKLLNNLDKENGRKEHSSSSAIVFLLVTLIFISLFMVAGILYLRFHNFSGVINLNKPDLNLSVADKLQKQIDDQAGEESIILTINESDINSLLTAYPDFPLKNPSATITEAGINLEGKYGILKVTVLVVPKLENGRIKYEIKEIQAASVPAPKKVADAVSGQLSTFLSGKMPNSKKVYLDTLILKKGLIQATGTKR
jgi:hypothetical protein